MLNEPLTSSSRWRIPTSEMTTHEARLSADRRSLIATVERIGAQAQGATRTVWHTAIVGLLVGGVLAPPALATVALVSLIAPGLIGVRHAASALIFVALLWLALAILGAHAQVGLRADPHDADPTHE